MRSRVMHPIAGELPTIFDRMGKSVPIQHLYEQIRQVSCTNLTVVIQGETGTGKELVAHYLHEYSDRAAQPFVAVDCGAIPESLAESEFFGYRQGAFTGANAKRAGHFEMAHGGTLFLDEIANLPLSIQMKLLRSLQERQITPLGSQKNLSVDVRIVVASSAPLAAGVEAGHFRLDLFHRLNEFTIFLPSLRDRREDILFLADRFRRESNAELQKTVQGFSKAAQAYLLTYDWPGNVRELRHAVRRAVLFDPLVIDRSHLQQSTVELTPPSPAMPNEHATPTPHGYALHDIVQEITVQLEKTLIQSALQEVQGNKSAAAKRLQIGHKTLYRRLKEYNLG
jgi:DNA-binding NtrC family response regulator